VTTGWEFVCRIVAAHGVAEGTEIVQGHVRPKIAWYRGDGAGSMFGGHLVVEEARANACAIMESD